jgi:hypothetical protein
MASFTLNRSRTFTLTGMLQLGLLWLLLCTSAAAQEVATAHMPAWEDESFVLEAAALSVSPQVYARIANRVQVGAMVGLGPSLAVAVTEHDYYETEDLLEPFYAGVALACRFAGPVGVELCPLRAALVVGNDWSSVYPGAHFKVFAAWSGVRVSSQLKLVRIAGGDGTGYYVTTWVPLLVALNF